MTLWWQTHETRNDIWSIFIIYLFRDSLLLILYQVYAYNDNFLFLFVGTYSQDDINDLLVESLKMKQLNQFNVMRLEGVCLDAGPAPFIVLPYMAGMCE